jgi:uncharacterized protein YkwD
MRRSRARRKPPKRKTRSFSWAALVVVVLVGLALALLPTARRLGLSRHGASDVGRLTRAGARRGDPAAGPERSPDALPPCPDGRAWNPEAQPARSEVEPPRDDPSADDAEDLSDAATNAARREHGLDALVVDEDLRAVARRHSEAMARRDFFSHEDPDGRTPGDRVHAGHRTLVGEAGENIWMCHGCWTGDAGAAADTVVNSEQGWMHSPGHRANILRESFTHTAVGIARHGRDLWATQLFSSTRGKLFAKVPAVLSAGDCLLLEMTPYPPDAVEATGFDLARLPGKDPVVDATPLGFNRLDVAPGRYRLRFHFPISARRYAIVSGPDVEVR